MASSGFEGFEKRLELVFSLPKDNGSARERHGLRLLSMDALQETLDAAQCTVVSAVGTALCDAYVLSESSLFLYPTRLILKTCGTTRLLAALPVLLRHAAGDLGLRLRSCRYSRGAYLIPDAQPFPHADFADEVRFLDEIVICPHGLLRSRRSAVLPGQASSHQWHVYVASKSDSDDHVDRVAHFTVEVCMTGLDATLARQFYLTPGDVRASHVIGDEMTLLSGLAGVPPRSSITCGYAFAPCGYSMNALDGVQYATVHVTPEDGYSYASYECGGGGGVDTGEAIASVRGAVAVFRPATVSISASFVAGVDAEAVAQGASAVCSAVADALEPLGLARRSQAAEDFPGCTTVTYQTFTRISHNAS